MRNGYIIIVIVLGTLLLGVFSALARDISDRVSDSYANPPAGNASR